MNESDALAGNVVLRFAVAEETHAFRAQHMRRLLHVVDTEREVMDVDKLKAELHVKDEDIQKLDQYVVKQERK